MDKKDDEVAFRDSLLDVQALLEKLGPLSSSVRELLEVVDLAVNNPAQLRLLMREIRAKR